MQLIDVAEFHTTFVAGVPAKVTVAPLTKPVPAMTTGVCATAKPVAGVELETVGAASKVYAAAKVSNWASGFVTVTDTVLGACMGDVQVSSEFETNVDATGAPTPNVIVALSRKLLPLIVTLEGIVAGPLIGATEETIGAKAMVNPPTRVPVPLSGFDTVTITGPTPSVGVVHVIEVLEFHTTPVASMLLNLTVAPETKFVPMTVTTVGTTPTAVAGETDVTVGRTKRRFCRLNPRPPNAIESPISVQVS